MGPGGPMNNGPMGPGGPMNSSGGMNNPGSSPMHDMHSPMGPSSGPNGMSQPMGSPMGGHMMAPSSKSSPMGMGGPGGPQGPDPTQPLPPSGMGPGNGFSSKNSPIMGGPSATTTDPTYAQQYHNFQQQLYATNSRSQGGPGGPSPGMGPMPPHHRDMGTPPHINNQNWLPSGPISK